MKGEDGRNKRWGLCHKTMTSLSDDSVFRKNNFKQPITRNNTRIFLSWTREQFGYQSEPLVTERKYLL